ncbi:type I restriction-modification system subunit M [Metamycoplasma buccale]|uniref:type I restriction-modification system subunit M n=1 Tax=Metamycoplasma buccale TaxID=55602 RepID=UPI00398EAB69
MPTEEKQKNQQSELHKRLWDIANDLRGNMEAIEFKNYILGLIFYRFLSDNLESKVNEILSEDNITYEDAWNNLDVQKELSENLLNKGGIGYIIEPKYLWKKMINLIKTNKFLIQILQDAINKLSNSILGKDSEEDFINLFEDMDLDSSKLGKYEEDKTKLISKVMLNIDDIDFEMHNVEIDVLGDAYEFLISKFASTAGKKAGEFYTPQQVSKLIAKIVTASKKELKNVYDPTCGSGSLLLRVAKESKKIGKFYGQEMVSTTFNLARMNMLLHHIPFDRFNIVNNDTLEHPSKDHLKMRFDAVVANPPYSAKWSADQKFLDDERFSAYGKLAPKSKADYAFVQHMIYLLDDNGTMAVVLPHGVLFRGGSEAVIRKYLIKNKNYLDAVIGLPANLFYGTQIPTCILVFKKCKTNDNVLFIDASREFDSGKNQNILTDENIEKIFKTYLERKDVDKYAHCATLKEIEENEYNLNIPRYVDTFEEEPEIDIHEVLANIKKLEEEKNSLDKEIEVYLKELGIIEK